MRSELFSADNLEKESAQPGIRLQNSKMLKVELNGEVMARRGAMVGEQGQGQVPALRGRGVPQRRQPVRHPGGVQSPSANVLRLTGAGMLVAQPPGQLPSPRTPGTRPA